jgi:hypothetical protein
MCETYREKWDGCGCINVGHNITCTPRCRDYAMMNCNGLGLAQIV